MKQEQQSPAEYSKDARRIQAVATTLETSLEANPKQQSSTNIKIETVKEKLHHNSTFNLSQFIHDLSQYVEWCEANQPLVEAAIQSTPGTHTSSHTGS
jgi:hypothetical protein